MATFEANPNSSNEPWIEKPAIEGLKFRIWHFMFFSFCAFTCLMVFICCCIKLRVPRTKQEIEADYHRKKLAEKFKKRLRLINNQEMDAIDLQKALEIIQQDYTNENRNYCYPGTSCPIHINDTISVNFENERITQTVEDASPHTSNFKRKATNIMSSTKFFAKQSTGNKESVS